MSVSKRTLLILAMLVAFWIAVFACGEAGKFFVYLIGCFAVGWHMGDLADLILDKLS